MRLVAGIALAVSLAALTGCASGSEPIAPSLEPAPEPVFASEEEALAAAKNAYEAYLKISDAVLADGGERPERIEPFAVAAARKAALAGYQEFRSANLESNGSTKLRSMILQSHDSDAVITYACLDVSDVDVLNSDGESVVSPGRPDMQAFEALFAEHPSKPGALILASREPWTGEGVC